MDEDESYDISIRAEDGVDDSGHIQLRSVVESALRRHAIARAALEIDIISDARMAALNEQYLAHNGPTDVLTFDLRRDKEDSVARVSRDAAVDGCVSRSTLDGQIVVSHETAQREADSRGHSRSAELCLYVVHGVLHLLGYDDHDETAAGRMHALEDELLQEAGVGPVFGRGCRES